MHYRMVRFLTLATALVFTVGLTACDEIMEAVDQGPYTLTFSGDASFNGPHGGQAIRVAVVPVGGATVETQSGTVSASTDPAFSFTFTDALQMDQTYEVHYWIDSNFGGGAEGYCNTKDIDHQWNESIGTVTEDTELTVPHDATATEAVCGTFAFDLTFNGEASFQGPHGGQTATLALVRSSDGAVLTTAQTTVSSSDDPAFTFSLPASLLPDDAYEAHLWIDSNFNGGTEGECDPPENDHQWNIDLGTATDDVTVSYPHDATALTSVCSSFQ